MLPFREKVSRLDFPGIVLVIAAVCCLILALQWGGQSKPWGSADVIGLLAGAALLASAFVIVQWRKGDTATIPLRIFRQRTILMGSLYLFFLEMAIYAVCISSFTNQRLGSTIILKPWCEFVLILAAQYLYYLPFYFQSAQMVDATQSGVRSIPLGLSQIAAVICCSTLVSFFGHYVSWPHIHTRNSCIESAHYPSFFKGTAYDPRASCSHYWHRLPRSLEC